MGLRGSGQVFFLGGGGRFSTFGIVCWDVFGGWKDGVVSSWGGGECESCLIGFWNLGLGVFGGWGLGELWVFGNCGCYKGWHVWVAVFKQFGEFGCFLEEF